MAWDGFFQGLSCRECGVALQGAGSGRPAESYAGTFNGLCYPCTGRPAKLVYVDAATGVGVYSHPPHCPSWRRDRERFYHAPGCKCRFGVSRWRSDHHGYSYPEQCGKCLSLFMWRERLQRHRVEQQRRAADYFEALDRRAERWRKGLRMKPAEAADYMLKSRIAQARREILQDVWNERPEYWRMDQAVLQ